MQVVGSKTALAAVSHRCPPGADGQRLWRSAPETTLRFSFLARGRRRKRRGTSTSAKDWSRSVEDHRGGGARSWPREDRRGSPAVSCSHRLPRARHSLGPSFGEQRRREVALAQVGQDDDDAACRRSPARRATATAPTTAAPQEMPQSMPSSRASRRAISKASSSRTVTTSSMTSMLSTSGMNPAPMPWILCGPGWSGS